MVKSVIFDFDGTLTPLTLDFTHLRREIEKIVVRYTDEDLLRSLENHFIIEMIYQASKETGDRDGAFLRDAFRRLTDLELDASRGKDLFPFARGVLRTLREKGIRTGIITRTSIEVIEQVFPDYRDLIDVVVSREHTRRLKPDPGHVDMAVGMLGAQKAQCITVGDHPTDVEAGRKSGTWTAGVLSGRTTREAFQQEGATYILENISHLIDVDILAR